MSPQKEQVLEDLRKDLSRFFPTAGMFTVRGNSSGFRLIINRGHFDINEEALFALKPREQGRAQIEFAGSREEIIESARAFTAASTKRPIKADPAETKGVPLVKRAADRSSQQTRV